MQGDFNIKGNKYAYMAKGKERPDFGALRPNAFDLFLKIQTSVSQALMQAGEDQRRYLNDLFSCTQRLSSFLYHSNRFPIHIKRIQSIVPPKNEMTYAAIDEACNGQVKTDTVLSHF
jgi:phosphatidylserine decarboxylase